MGKGHRQMTFQSLESLLEEGPLILDFTSWLQHYRAGGQWRKKRNDSGKLRVKR
jgi:hypothetical protein